MTPLAAVFDIGKVLLDFDYRIAARAIAAQASATPEEVFAQLNAHSELLREYETGLMSTPDFYARVSGLTGYRGALADFRQVFADIFTPIGPIIALHAQLHARGVPTYIFSNTNEMAIAHIRAAFPFFRNFTDYVLSYEQTAMKPHPRIYEAVEKITSVPRERLLYIDDRPENVEEGARRGWQAIHHTDNAATIDAVKKSGVLGE
ncbi:MAG: HAD family phosphatase [Verrucomicrobia bacterium]|nr:HAD family phosphatase [Verrucomicrobiota bacterium]